MSLKHIAEYVFSESFIFSYDSIFVTHSMQTNYSFAKIYRFPNVLLESFSFYSCSSVHDLSVSLNSTNTQITISSDTTHEEHTYDIEEISDPLESSSIKRSLMVKNGACNQSLCVPTVYIHGQQAFAVEDKEIDGFYHSTDEMKLYTYIPSKCTIKEYALFAVEKIYPKGLCFLFPDHMTVNLPSQSYTLPAEFTNNMRISFFEHKNTLHSVFSSNGLIMYKNQFKKYPDGFTPTKIWNKYFYMYLFSAHSRRLLVLNRNLEIEYEMGATDVFVSDEYVFISKHKKTIAHRTKTFSFSFLLEDFSVTDDVISVETVGNLVLIFTLEKILKRTTPLFSLFITEIDTVKKTVVKRSPSPSPNSLWAEHGFNIFYLAENPKKPYLTTGVFDISVAVRGDKYLAFGVSANSVLVFWPDNMVQIPITAIEKPFSFTHKKNNTSVFVGVPIQIDAEKGTLHIVREGLSQECIFPVLLLLHASGVLPGPYLFSLFSQVPEYKTSIERTLFYFLQTEDIEGFIDIIESIKMHAAHIYEEVVSTMLRLLDEKNIEKLYNVIDRADVKDFKCAVSLRKALIQDFSLFERFLDSAIAQRKEHLVFEFVDFASKIEDPELHSRILALLLKNTMLYTSGMFLSKINVPSRSDEIERDSLVETYMATNSIVEQIKERKEPAEILERIFTGKDALLIAMVAERLCILSGDKQ
ncbi:hypothetical protein NEMIN01_1657 [Nematocida minor]|uniref:uncharacterized protein n=1 Tax=Nematocida minor TaxID=1912983 RepID=UPI00221E4BFD|nr:uncharacterized protein NEMIN01_1657 [Nematocida minor]KAI5191766.1 hypothetical protein NEMIN01_1657 [Nematocida minor]